MSETIDVVIIGAGPAGYTAGIYAARAGLRPVIFAGLAPGGQLTITSEVENYPGFKSIQGPELMEKIGDQAISAGADVQYDLVTNVDLEVWPHVVTLDSGKTVTTRAIIIATGATARWLGLESEQNFTGFGVSACATCDGFFFKEKHVIVVGGGNTAVEESLYLTRHCASVTLVHRGTQLRAEKVLIDRLTANPKISVIFEHVLDEIHGTLKPKSVNGATIRHRETGQSSHLDVDGVFVAIGHDPASSLFQGKLDMDSHGYIKVAPWSTVTSVPTVFAAGDVADSVYRQAITSAGMGCMAALEVERLLSTLDHLQQGQPAFA